MKSLVIGLDGASFNVLEPWIAGGQLPTLAKLIEEGCSGMLKSTIPPLTCPAVPCLYTGKNPGKLGVGARGFVNPDGSPVSVSDIDSSTVWDILGGHGLRSCIANLRSTYPPQPLHGVMIAGSPPSPDSQYVFPSHLQKQTAGFHISNKAFMELKTQISDRQRVGLDTLKDLIWKRYHVFKGMVEKDTFDFGLLWIESTDVIQHWSWKNPRFIMDVFQEVDKVLADVVSSFADANILVVSDHGFEEPYYRRFNVNVWLRQQGFLRLNGSPALSQFLHQSYQSFKKRLPPNVLRVLKKFREHAQKTEKVRTNSTLRAPVIPGADWQNGGAYLDTHWGIRVVPGNMSPDEVDQFTQGIVDKLEGLHDGTGRKVAKGVWRREQVYSGPYVSEFPDVVFLLNQYEPYKTLTGEALPHAALSPKFGRHDFAPEGIIIAYGPDMQRGVELKEASILDVTPTVLHMMGTAIPTETDGRVLQQVFKERSEPGTRPVIYSDSDYKSSESPVKHSSTEEEELIIARLRGLGYLE
jgi:predicted AlkP superfamily phosphohydrolase/phosphomutase